MFTEMIILWYYIIVKTPYIFQCSFKMKIINYM